MNAIQKSAFRYQPDRHPFDFIYALGLFDYLNAEQSRLLLEKMFAALRPGGRLIVDNIDSEAHTIGYCGAMIDWWRILKSQTELAGIAENLPGSSPADCIQVKQVGCSNYLLIEKAQEQYLWV
jgi:hypothetical protein